MHPLLLATALALCDPGCHSHAARKITIDLQNADITNVIRLLGDVSGKNVVFGEDVKGKVTVKLKNVPWDEALRVILRTHGLGLEEDDDILYVAPQEKIDAEHQRALDLAAKRQLVGPLTTRVVPLNYTPAAEMVEKVKPLLSPRGSVTVDERTNSLIIRDVRGAGALAP